MSIALVSQGTPTEGTGLIAPGSPPSIIVGNWLIAYFAEEQGTDPQPTTPTNWTLISPTANHSGIIIARVADGVNDAMPSINYGGNDQIAYCEQWSGLPSTIAAGNVTGNARQQNSTSGVQTGGVSPTVDGCLLIGFMCRNKTTASNGATWGNWTAGGGTFIQNDFGAPNGARLMWLVQYLIQSTKQSIALGNANTSSPADSAAQATASWTIAIQPAISAPVPFPPTNLGGMNVQVCM